MVEEGQNECPNPESHSTIFHRLPFCPPEVALGSGYSTGRTPLGLCAPDSCLTDVGTGGKILAMGQPKRPICPNCEADLILALPPGGKGQRTFQCFDCDRPDPMKTDEATGWLSGELGRTELGGTD